MKKLNWSLIRKLAFAIIAVAWVLTAGITLLVSWSSYQSYYNEMMEFRKQLAEANREPVTTFHGIEISLTEGRQFFNNGMARPTKADFVVVGKFDTDGRAFDEEIIPVDYDLTIPEDFSENGGEIIAKYIFKEAKEVPILDENGNEILDDYGDPIMEETEVETEYEGKLQIELIEVVLKQLTVVSDPYLVRYKEGAKFNITGLCVVMEYNDGSIIEDVAMSEVVADSKNLSTQDEFVEISYNFNGTIVKGKVPVEVMSVSEFTNGKMIGLSVDGVPLLNVGEQLSSVALNVFAKYDSGNLVNIESENYKIVCNDVAVELGKDYQIIVKSLENTKVTLPLSVGVCLSTEAETATLSDCTANDDFVSEIIDGSSISFSVNVSASGYVKMYAKMSNGYLVATNGQIFTKEIAISDIVKVYVNGILKDVDGNGFATAGPFLNDSQALNYFKNIYLGQVFLSTGVNEIKIQFKSANAGQKNYHGEDVFGYFDCVDFVCLDETVRISNVGQYFKYIDENSLSANYQIDVLQNFTSQASVGTYIENATSDGEFIYFTYVAYSGQSITDTINNGYKKEFRIVKYNPTTKSIVGYSDIYIGRSSGSWTYGEYLTSMYKDGFIYTYDNNGKALKISTDNLNTNGTNKLVEAPELLIPKGRELNSLNYNAVLDKYVTLSSSGITIYNSNQEKETAFALTKSTFDCGSAYRSYVNAEYIYILYQKDNIYTPGIQIYKWDGTLIKEVVIPISATTFGVTHNSSNVQSIVEIDNSLYFSIISWKTGTQSGIVKVDFVIDAEAKSERISLGDYVQKCESKAVEVAYSTAIVSQLKEAGAFIHGATSDDVYGYITTNSGQTTVIYKVDLKTGAIVGKTAQYPTASQSENSNYLFYRDGYIYMVTNEKVGESTVRNVVKVRTEDIDASATATFEIDNSFGVIKQTFTPHAITYNSAQNKYAAVGTDNEKLYIMNGITKSVEISTAFSKKKVLGVSSDANNIYVLYESGNNGGANMFIYDWAGNLVKNLSMPEVFPGIKTQTNNTQGMFIIDGDIYFAICCWTTSQDSTGASVASGAYITKVTLDYSVIK